MKASRAYIAGLGTTGILLAFALLLLVVFGAILAARGWPDAAAGSDAEAVRLDAGEGITRIAPVRLEPATATPDASVPGASPEVVRGAAAPDRGGVRGTDDGGGASTRSASQAPAAESPNASPAAPSASSLPAAPGVPAAPGLPGVPAAPALPAAAPGAPSVAAPELDAGAADGVGRATGVAETALP